MSHAEFASPVAAPKVELRAEAEPEVDLLLDGTALRWVPGLQVDADDPVVREVISQVEYCLERHNMSDQILSSSKGPSGEQIEVEGRLGVFLDPFTHERLKLPVDTEVLLCEASSDGEFSYRFGSSISQYHFECFTRSLCKELGLENSDLAVHGDLHKPVSRMLPMETMDVFINYQDAAEADGDDDQRVRVSFDPDGQNVLEAIRKEAQIKLNVYSGQDAHEDEVQLLVNESGDYHDGQDELRTAVDFRISVNKECSIAPQVVSQIISRGRDRADTFRRRRSRKSYPLFGVFRVDTTVVQSQQGRGYQQRTKTSHEIELEINPYVLYYHFLKKRRGDPTQRLDLVLANFVGILRSWTAFLNTNGTAELLTQKRSSNQTSLAAGAFGADLRDCAVTADQLRDYLEYVSPVVPLIGDYAFRCVVEHCKALPTKMSPEDVADSVRLHLNDEELATLHAKQEEKLLALNGQAMNP